MLLGYANGVLERLRAEEADVQEGTVNGGNSVGVSGEGEGRGADDMAKQGHRIVCYGGTDTGRYAAVEKFWMREEKIYFYTPEEADELWK